MGDEENTGLISNILVLIIESHSWLELIYLLIVIYISMPTKLVNGLLGGGSNIVEAKLSKWPNDLALKLFGPLLIILYFLLYAFMPLWYSFLGIVFVALASAVFPFIEDVFDIKQMFIETAVLGAFSFAYCQIEMALKKIEELKSEINQIQIEKDLEEARLSRIRESTEKQETH
jgi:hypothetical protein